MNDLDIVDIRLRNQLIVASTIESPAEVVAWFGAMQAQDFAAAKWALGLRTDGQTEADIEQAFTDGLILRTHIMRPTWHFVAPADIRWLLALTAPRVLAFSGSYFRKSGLDRAIFARSNAVIHKSLVGGKQLTRNELGVLLEDAEIPIKDLGLSFILMQAELMGIICSGPRRGKQFTYMLLDERVPQTMVKSRDESLMELIKRYFQSHGPAQIQDFVWWSGLTVADAKKGIELVGSKLHKLTMHDKTYWFFDSVKVVTDVSEDAFLLPGFDEYFIAYKDRSDILDKKYTKHLNMGGGMINGAVVIGGKMIGGWKRTLKSNEVVIRLQIFEKLTDSQEHAIHLAAAKYGKFLEMKVIFS